MAEDGRMNEGDHMKAVIIRGYGGPDVIELADVPVPQPGTGQVRIRVGAAPVHPVDIATRAGRLAEHGLMAASGDVGLGWDLAGVVDALGPGTRARSSRSRPAPRPFRCAARACTTSGSTPTGRG
jgi:NADPH:quinone reductase-like Zn-dependent oxidoreductase